jgi:hypothetical protein
MNCNDCCLPIDRCKCGLYGGKRTTDKLRALAEKKRQETKALLKLQHDALRPAVGKEGGHGQG